MARQTMCHRRRSGYSSYMTKSQPPPKSPAASPKPWGHASFGKRFVRSMYPVLLLCQALDVSPNGYYAWEKKPTSPRKKEEARLEIEIKAAHKRTRCTYGPERLQAELADHGVQVGIHRIKRIRKKLGLRCKQKRKFKATTNSNHSLPVAENLLEQKFTTDAPNRVWLTDITYVNTAEGWLYLAGHKDLFTGQIVGYAMSNRMTRNLVSQSLFAGPSSSLNSGKASRQGIDSIGFISSTQP